MFNQFNVATKGEEGEALVLEELKKVFSDEQIYPKFMIPGHKFDIDFVILCSKGVLVLEVKNYSERIVFYKKTAKKIRTIDDFKTEETQLLGKSDPRDEVIRHSRILNEYLYALGFDNVEVKKALVLVDDVADIKEKTGVYIVSGARKLQEFINSIHDDERFDDVFCVRIKEALGGE